MDASEFLDGAGARTREAYGRDLRLLTYDRFLALVLQDPYALGRSAVQFAVDALDHFGVRKVPGIGGTVVRHALFDAPFAGGRGAVHGQEAVQERLVRVLRSAAEEGRLDRLVVLHGPNGSSKSTLVECLMRGIAHYSTLPEGALYRFHWVFPRRGEHEEDLGFTPKARGMGESARSPEREHGSYALLEPDDIAARVPCELRDNPLLLLPAAVRREVLAEGGRETPPPPAPPPPRPSHPPAPSATSTIPTSAPSAGRSPTRSWPATTGICAGCCATCRWSGGSWIRASAAAPSSSPPSRAWTPTSAPSPCPPPRGTCPPCCST